MSAAAGAKSFRDLLVWQRAHELVLAVYHYSASFPRHEVYGLSAQLRRSAVSVPANIAEGFRRRGRADKVRFLNIAQASLEESRYYLILAQDLHYGASEGLQATLEEVSRMLQSYARAIMEVDR